MIKFPAPKANLQFATAYAKAINGHIVMISATGSLEQLEADLGNVFDYDGDHLEMLADQGSLYLPRTDHFDALALIADIRAAARYRNVSTTVSLQIVGPHGELIETCTITPVVAALPAPTNTPAAPLRIAA